MRIKIKKSMSNRKAARLVKKARVRKKVLGTLERPRLCVYKSLKYTYAQLIDDVSGKTLVALSDKEIRALSGTGQERAFKVGQKIAEKAKMANFEKVVFDRNGFVYHGRVKALADGAREAGLKF
jgi:large subunit ribosomal protein L18